MCAGLHLAEFHEIAKPLRLRVVERKRRELKRAAAVNDSQPQEDQNTKLSIIERLRVDPEVQPAFEITSYS